MSIESVIETLSQLAASDPQMEVRLAASEALGKIYRRLELTGASGLEAVAEAGREVSLETSRSFIAHEIKNAIVPLAASARRLGESATKAEADQVTELAERILRQSQEVDKVVNRFLDFAQPLNPRPEPVGFDQMIAQSLVEMRPVFEENQIEVFQQLEAQATVMADRILLAQVWRNLLANAVEAMKQGGRLTVKTTRENGRARVTFSDTGTGIKPEYLSRIFELGFSTKKGQRGSGTGLALARRIVQVAHHGFITLTNNPTLPGAVASVSLPVVTEGGTNGKQNFAPAHR